MADSKVSALTPATTPLAGTEIVYVVQSGEDRQATAQDIADLAPAPTVSADGVTYDNATSGLSASDVQGAIDELASQTIVIPDSQIVSALSNSFALKCHPTLDSPSGAYFDITSRVATASAGAHSRAFRGSSGGKWYCEFAISGTPVGGSTTVGVVQPSTLADSTQVGSNGTGTAQSWAVLPNGNRYSGSSTAYGVSWTAGDVIMVAIDMTLSVGSRKIWFGRNGTWFASGNPAAGTGEAFANLPLIVAPGTSPSTGVITLRLRSSEFSHSPPSGYSAWVT